MENRKYLPVGTVVLLKEGNHRLIIVGFCTIPNPNQKKVYDYIGYFYPEGVIELKESYAFNHSDIKQIYYMGYSDKEEKNFKKQLEDFTKKNIDDNGYLKNENIIENL